MLSGVVLLLCDIVILGFSNFNFLILSFSIIIIYNVGK